MWNLKKMIKMNYLYNRNRQKTKLWLPKEKGGEG